MTRLIFTLLQYLYRYRDKITRLLIHLKNVFYKIAFYSVVVVCVETHNCGSISSFHKIVVIGCSAVTEVVNGVSFLIMFLNGTVFSTIALTLSFLAKSYTDAPRFTSYIIMPMSFLCNTFFSTDQMPAGFRQVISLLPLSQASAMIRAIAGGEAPGWFGFAVLLAYLIVFGAISVAFIYRKKNL